MPRVGSTFKYKVKYVRHFQTKNGTATSFSISEKISGSMPTQYQSYSFVVWADIKIKDDDFVHILSIDSIYPTLYKNKVYTNINGTIAIAESEAKTFAEEQVPSIDSKPQPETDEFHLPFDL